MHSRYNDFKHDPLSRCNCTPPYSGENAISARCDLNPADGKFPFAALGHRKHGGTDAKVNAFGSFFYPTYSVLYLRLSTRTKPTFVLHGSSNTRNHGTRYAKLNAGLIGLFLVTLSPNSISTCINVVLKITFDLLNEAAW